VGLEVSDEVAAAYTKTGEWVVLSGVITDFDVMRWREGQTFSRFELR